MLFRSTAPKALEKALGPGFATWTETRVLPALSRLAGAASGAEKKRVEQRLEELRALIG